MDKNNLMFFQSNTEGCDIVAFDVSSITTKYNCYDLYKLEENADYELVYEKELKISHDECLKKLYTLLKKEMVKIEDEIIEQVEHNNRQGEYRIEIISENNELRLNYGVYSDSYSYQPLDGNAEYISEYSINLFRLCDGIWDGIENERSEMTEDEREEDEEELDIGAGLRSNDYFERMREGIIENFKENIVKVIINKTESEEN